MGRKMAVGSLMFLMSPAVGCSGVGEPDAELGHGHAVALSAPELLHPGKGAAPRPDAAGEAADFSTYLLALSWAPNFCKTHPEREQCADIGEAFAGSHLTLHGLWPNFNDDEAREEGCAYPQFCGHYAACFGGAGPGFCVPSTGTLPEEFAELAPGYLTDGHSLAKREWPKHGSCTGFSASEYFEVARRAMVSMHDRGTPSLIVDNVGESVPLADLQEAFSPPGSAAFSCDGGCNLAEVYTCWSKDKAGGPGELEKCPRLVSSSTYNNSCVTRRCEEVHIEEPGAVHQRWSARSKRQAKAAPHGNALCDKNGKGPSCSSDGDCLDAGWLRCAGRSQCCTGRVKPVRN